MEIPNVDIYINNVTCTFRVGCNLSLDTIRLPNTRADVVYKKKKRVVIMKFRRPSATASIYSSGKITLTGSNSEEHAEKTAKKCVRELKKMGYKARFLEFKVVSIFGSCSMPFAIRIRGFAEKHPTSASYEPELHAAVIYKPCQPRATLQIFHTGSILVAATAVGNISEAIEHIYPLVKVHRMPLTEDMKQKRLAKKRKRDGVGEDEGETTDDEQVNEGAGDEDSGDEDAGDEDAGDEDTGDEAGDEDEDTDEDEDSDEYSSDDSS